MEIASKHRTVVDVVDVAMQRYAEKVAFRCLGDALTYRAVDRTSRAFAAYLQTRLGVKKGDRVALMLPNVLAFPIASLGILRCGAVQVNVNPLYTPRELEHQLNDAGARVIVVAAGVSSTLAAAVGATRIEHVVTVNPGDRTDAFATALAEGSELPFAPVAIDAEDLALLQYTGGTTGISKGAALSHRNIVANIEQIQAVLPQASRPGEEVVLTPLPLFHIFGLTVNFLTFFSLGAENWLVPNPRDIDAVVDVLKASRATVLTGVNTLYATLLGHERIREVDFSRLRAAIGGGAAVLRVTSERWRALTGQHLLEGYGLSETAPVLTLNPGDGTFSETVGRTVPWTTIKLLDDEDKEVPLGIAGEICARGPQVMRGYWEKPEANRAAFTADGFFRTGDVGVFDERGYLKIVDRKKDMILVSGFNVYPNELEAVVATCAGIAECACIGVPDERTGEAVRIFATRTPGSTVSEIDVIAHCREGLAAYKVPKRVVFMDALPKSAVGKILRKELREVRS
jgi:long-chain acyl-CoA synthetase